MNLGGFENISIKANKQITAFDICPVNMVLNQLCNKVGFEYDNNGDIAKSGKLIPQLFNILNNLPFYNKLPPKSLSREWVEEFIYPLIKKKYIIIDVLYTFCEHIALQIGAELKDGSTLITGGGTFNTYLISRINHYAHSKIIIPDEEIINFKEAMLFGFLGVLKMRDEINCLKSVTGAIKNSCSGIIHRV